MSEFCVREELLKSLKSKIIDQEQFDYLVSLKWNKMPETPTSAQYVIRHTDYINCCYSGKNYKEGDTPIAKVSPHAKDWKVFRSEHSARMTLRGIHYMSTTKMIDKNYKRPPFEYKWVVEKYVDNVSITSTQ